MTTSRAAATVWSHYAMWPIGSAGRPRLLVPRFSRTSRPRRCSITTTAAKARWSQCAELCAL